MGFGCPALPLACGAAAPSPGPSQGANPSKEQISVKKEVDEHDRYDNGRKNDAKNSDRRA